MRRSTRAFQAEREGPRAAATSNGTQRMLAGHQRFGTKVNEYKYVHLAAFHAAARSGDVQIIRSKNLSTMNTHTTAVARNAGLVRTSPFPPP